MTQQSLSIQGRQRAEKPLLNDCKEVMRRGSLSFFLAARLLGREARDAISMLYAWCRFADDLIDSTAERLPPKERGAVVDELREKTTQAVTLNDAGLDIGAPLGYQAIGQLGRLYKLPAEYPLELTRGMQMDAEGVIYEDLPSLRLYCYRVAGVVGVMFSHIIGVSDSAALPHAADLGIAMQMTNIARDVLEDAAMGRIYLPRSWLREAGIPADPRLFPTYKKELALVTQRLLAVAEDHYKSGEKGLKYLPLRAAAAVAAARYIYHGIGTLVLARGPYAWDSRAVVPFRTKLLLLGRGLSVIIRGLPYRIFRPWHRQQISDIWRYQVCSAPQQ